MKLKNFRHGRLMGVVIIIAAACLLLENDSLSRCSVFAEAAHHFSQVVEEQCSSFAREAAPCSEDDGTWLFHLPNEFTRPLSGQWEQQKGSANLLPLLTHSHDQHQEENVLKLASLSLHPRIADFLCFQISKVASFTASLCFHISNTKRSLLHSNVWKSVYGNQRGRVTQLCISFQGIFTETDDGEQNLCLLGRSKVPLRHFNASSHNKWLAPNSLEDHDDQILLGMRIPPSDGLTTRKIVARLTSLRASDHPMFFDPVDIAFLLDYSPPYKFITESMVESACNAQVHEEKFTDLELYHGKNQQCEFLRSLLYHRSLEGVPNWQCKGTAEYCNRVGPFSNQGGLNNSTILVQRFECFGYSADLGINISAAIGVVPAGGANSMSSSGSVRENQNNIWIQGTWSNASPGKICMVGCLEYSTRTPSPACELIVSLYFPRSLSLKQRNMVVGSISSIHADSSKAFYPLSIENPIQPGISLPYGFDDEMSYSYANNTIAESLLERKHSTETMVDMARLHLFRYPWKKEGQSRNSFYILGRDLSLHSATASRGINSKTMMNLDIIAIENFVGMDLSDTSEGYSYGRHSCLLKEDQTSQEEKPLLKVAAQLNLQGIVLPLFKLFVEGVYDPQTGKMDLIGCRDIRAKTEILQRNSSIHVEDGLDCEIELKLQYPPTNFRLFIDRSVKASIRSNRREDDPLYFQKAEFHTAQIFYIGETVELIPPIILESVLKILCLCFASACIVSQSLYVRQNAEAGAYTSLVMVGIQAFSFCISLIAGTDYFYFKSSDPLFQQQQYTCLPVPKQNPPPLFDILNDAMLLLAFTFTIRLFYTIWQSRLRFPQIPSEKGVLVRCGVIYAIVFVFQIRDSIAQARHNAGNEFGNEALRPYVRMIQELFLVPQIYAIPQLKYNGKSLRKFYYVGITALCYIPQIYNYAYNRHSQLGIGLITAVIVAVMACRRVSGAKDEEARR